MCPSDVDHNAVLIERFGEKSCIDDEGRAVHGLSRTEDGSTKRMGDHNVVADLNSEQETLLTNMR